MNEHQFTGDFTPSLGGHAQCAAGRRAPGARAGRL